MCFYIVNDTLALKLNEKIMTTKTNRASKPLPSRGQYKIYLIAFIAAVLTFGIGTYVALDGRPPGWEASFFNAVNGMGDGWYLAFTIITFFGSTWMSVLTVAATLALRAYRLAWRLAVTIISAYAITIMAKIFIDRERPAEILAGVNAYITEPGLGFPSGHASGCAVIALTIWPYLPRKARFIIVPLFIILIGLSRIYLGVHLPLDIIGGVAIGVAVVSFLRIMPQTWRRAIRID